MEHVGNPLRSPVKVQRDARGVLVYQQRRLTFVSRYEVLAITVENIEESC